MKIRLQVFNESCENCGASFRALHQSPHDYGFAVFVGEHGHIAVAVADEDGVWQEAKGLLKQLFDGPISDRDVAKCFPYVFERTVDDASGDRLFMWGRIPCPRCTHRRRSFSAPVEPPEFLDMDVNVVTHHRWETLSAEEKRREAAGALHLCRSDGGVK